jgi:SAM-dependent methyltransferase
MYYASYYRWLVVNDYLKVTIPPTSVLDVGCDDGYFLSRIHARLKAGVDLAPPPRQKQYHLVIRGDGRHLPFRPGSFDTVLALDVLEHVEDDETLLHSLVEAVAEGGRLWLSTPSENFNIFPAFMTSRAERGWGHVRRGYSLEKLGRKLPSNVEATPTYWHEPFFRMAYVALRLIWVVSPSLARWLAACCARLDNLARDGKAGHMYVEIKKP